MKKKLLVLGPVAQVLIVLIVLLAALAFRQLGSADLAGILVGGVVSRFLSLLPVARGRPGDIARVVTRAHTSTPPSERP
jgi:hypothetical protein